MGLDVSQMEKLAGIVKHQVAAKGVNAFEWVNSPMINGEDITHKSGTTSVAISTEEAFHIFKKKLDGVYAERFVLAICTSIAAVNAGKDVSLLQFQNEPNLPFDANGWLVLAIEGHPVFHISPTDLSAESVKELVTVVAKGTVEAERYSWKGNTKADDLCLLLEILT